MSKARRPLPPGGLVSLLYDAAMSVGSWNDTVEAIRARLGGHSANLLSVGRQGVGVLHIQGVGEQNLRDYEERYAQFDEMTLQLHQLAPGHHYFTQDVFPQPMLRETLIYEDFYKKLGFAYFAAANLNAADGGVGFLSIARSESDGPFQQNERQMMQALAPHIARAVRIHASFADLPNPAAAISRTEQWPTPWLLVDGLGRILFRNTAAEAVQKDAVFEDDSGYLKLPDAQAQRTLREMLRWTAQDSPMRLQQPVRCRASLGRVLLTCFPVSNDSFSSFHSNLLGPRFGVTLHVEGTGVALNDAWLMELFDFTRAEARMAVQLARGLSQAEIAQHLHLSIDSVRTHTKRLLAKAGVRSQAALLAKLFATFSGPAGSAVD